MSSTFTQPIRIFKRNNPTNDGTIAPDNTGAAVVSQQAAISGITPATVVVPAGAIIQTIQSYIVTAPVTGTAANVTIDSVVVGTLSNTGGVNTAAFGTGTTGVAKLANVGDVDATVSYAAITGAAGVLSVTYTARNSDGTITAYGSGYTNN
jgi:hypothetical protein